MGRIQGLKKTLIVGYKDSTTPYSSDWGNWPHRAHGTSGHEKIKDSLASMPEVSNLWVNVLLPPKQHICNLTESNRE